MISPKPERLTALLLALARDAGLALSGIFSPGVWRTSLAGLDSGPAWRGFVISRAELARWRRSHSAYSGTHDIERLLSAYGCTAVQQGAGRFRRSNWV